MAIVRDLSELGLVVSLVAFNFITKIHSCHTLVAKEFN